MAPITSAAQKASGSTRGRPRDDSRTEAIIRSASELLLEAGFDHLTIQAVADRAGSGTGAIYRRWGTKEALIADAIRAVPDHEPETTDDPIADLRSLVMYKIEAFAAAPDLLPGAVTAIRSSQEVAAAVIERYNDDVFEQAIARVVGDDSPHLQLLASTTTAVALHRSTFKGAIEDPRELADQIVDLILAARNTADS